MGFVSDRLYAGISRREFSDPQQPGCLWGVSKVVHTPTTAAWAAVNYPGMLLCGRCRMGPVSQHVALRHQHQQGGRDIRMVPFSRGLKLRLFNKLSNAAVAPLKLRHCTIAICSCVASAWHLRSHSCALCSTGVTMADDYFSAWECRTILSPWADAATGPNAEPQPACALIL